MATGPTRQYVASPEVGADREQRLRRRDAAFREYEGPVDPDAVGLAPADGGFGGLFEPVGEEVPARSRPTRRGLGDGETH